MSIVNDLIVNSNLIPKTLIPNLDLDRKWETIPEFNNSSDFCFTQPVSNPNLLSPMIKATLVNQGNEKMLQVDALVTTFTEWNFAEMDFLTLFGVVKTDRPVLIVRLQTNIENSFPTNLGRTVFLFRRTFSQDNINTALAVTRLPHIDIDQISNVFLDVHNVNPNTSRGTETTVQETGGSS